MQDKIVTLKGSSHNFQFCQRLGWKGEGGHFDILPMVFSVDGQPKYYNVPKALVLEVPITHPKLVLKIPISKTNFNDDNQTQLSRIAFPLSQN